MSSGSACWILWLTPMDWLALSIGRSGSQPLEYSVDFISGLSGLLYRTGWTSVNGILNIELNNYLYCHKNNYIF